MPRIVGLMWIRGYTLKYGVHKQILGRDFAERSVFLTQNCLANLPKCFNVNQQFCLLLSNFNQFSVKFLSNFCQISVCVCVIGLKSITEIDSYERFTTGNFSWASHFCSVARPKIEKFIFPNSAERCVFLGLSGLIFWPKKRAAPQFFGKSK